MNPRDAPMSAEGMLRDCCSALTEDGDCSDEVFYELRDIEMALDEDPSRLTLSVAALLLSQILERTRDRAWVNPYIIPSGDGTGAAG